MSLPREWLDTAEQRATVAQWARDYDWGPARVEDPAFAADQITGELGQEDAELSDYMLARLNAELIASAARHNLTLAGVLPRAEHA